MVKNKDTGLKNIKLVLLYFIALVIGVIILGYILGTFFNLDTSLFAFIAIMFGLIYVFIVLVQDHLAHKRKEKKVKTENDRTDWIIAVMLLVLGLLFLLWYYIILKGTDNLAILYVYFILIVVEREIHSSRHKK